MKAFDKTADGDWRDDLIEAGSDALAIDPLAIDALAIDDDRGVSAWTRTCAFGRGGVLPDGRHRQLHVTTLNVALGAARYLDERLRLLDVAVARLDADAPSLLLLPAGFFGCFVDAKGAPRWSPPPSVLELERILSTRAASWSSSWLVALGVDFSAHNQRQWWLAGGHKGLYCDIARGLDGAPTALGDRIVSHQGLRAMGFVCGEVCKWSLDDLTAHLPGVDLVAVSAHVQVNRIHDPDINPDYRRCPFQRRFVRLAEHCGAALAQSRGREARYVVNCDNWFVHRDKSPFPGERFGQPIR